MADDPEDTTSLGGAVSAAVAGPATLGLSSPSPSQMSNFIGSENSRDLSSPGPAVTAVSTPKDSKKGQESSSESKQFVKRPLNPYMIFTKTERVKIMQEDPKMKMFDVSRLMGERWKRMSDKEKRPYVEKAKVAKAEQKMALQANPHLAYRPQKSREQKEAERKEIAERKKYEKEGGKKDGNMPRPPTMPSSPYLASPYAPVPQSPRVVMLGGHPHAPPHPQQAHHAQHPPPPSPYHQSISSVAQALGVAATSVHRPPPVQQHQHPHPHHPHHHLQQALEHQQQQHQHQHQQHPQHPHHQQQPGQPPLMNPYTAAPSALAQHLYQQQQQPPPPPPQQIAGARIVPQQPTLQPTITSLVDLYYTSLCAPAFPEPGELPLTPAPPHVYLEQLQQQQQFHQQIANHYQGV